MIGRRHRREEQDVVHSVTTAPTLPHDDTDDRQRNYLIMMGIRIVCFVLVLVIPHPIRWLFLVVAVFIPYVAVVIANAHRPATRGTITPVDHRPPGHRQLGR